VGAADRSSNLRRVVAVRHGLGRALLDLGQGGIGDGRVRLGLLLGLDGSLGVGRLRGGLGLDERGTIGDGGLLNLGDWGRSVFVHTPRQWSTEALTSRLQRLVAGAARLLIRTLH
jgi:hypothetical protein